MTRRIPSSDSLTIEFKSDRAKLSDNDLLLAIVCLANTDGGVLYLGVEDDGAITGLHPEHRDLTGLAAMIANRTVPQLCILVVGALGALVLLRSPAVLPRLPYYAGEIGRYKLWVWSRTIHQTGSRRTASTPATCGSPMATHLYSSTFERTSRPTGTKSWSTSSRGRSVTFRRAPDLNRSKESRSNTDCRNPRFWAEQAGSASTLAAPALVQRTDRIARPR